MSEIVNASYKIVQERSLPVIASEIIQIERDVYAVAIDGAIQIGQKLHEAKEKVEYGQWENWCKENLNYSTRKAQEFMQIADSYGDENSAFSKARMSAEVSISKALKLLAVPEEEVEVFTETHDIEGMTVRELETEIKKLKDEKEELKSEKEAAYETAAKAEAEITKLANAKFEAQDQAKEYADTCEQLRSQLEAEKNKESDTADSKTISELQNKLEEKEKELKKSEEQFKALEESFDEAEKATKEKIEAAKQKAMEKAIKDSGVPKLKAQIEELERKLANSADDNKVRFKVLVDDVQDTWNSCVFLARSDESGNMIKALNVVVESMKEQLL